MPSFITLNGPVREARFKFNRTARRDGGVHALFVITGHPDAARLQHPAGGFRDAGPQPTTSSSAFPTPTFGAGLIEQITDSDDPRQLSRQLDAAQGASVRHQRARPNRNGNDGTITRFGWKAQNKSLLLFSGEAYNVEMGITNELFQNERDETPSCQFADGSQRRDTDEPSRQIDAPSQNFANFQRFLAPPMPSSDYARRLRARSTGPPAVHRRRLRALPHADAQDRRYARWPPCATRT